jgi:1,4-dihydroxy-2-naphthoate polyprenyltransferase
MLKKIISLFDKDTIVHLRLPFSFFLLPIFCFAISQAKSIDYFNTLIVFIVLHLFVYPGSNIYNSYMDNDKGSIGGLKNPPPATIKLFYMSIIFDVVGLILSFYIGYIFFLIILVYIGVSKAYSWKKIRLKKYSVLGWLVVIIFQGGYTFLLVNMAAENNFTNQWFTIKNITAMIIASLLIGGYYPLSQIYQHQEDSERGDFTISYKLGLTGTFIFAGLLFLISFVILWYYFNINYNINHFYIFSICNLPVVVYFNYWFLISLKNKSLINYINTMRLTIISSLCMITCYSILFVLNH